MKKYKKLVMIFLSLCIVFALASCDAIFDKAKDIAQDKIEDELKKNDDEDDDEDETTEEDEDEDETTAEDDEDETTEADDDEDTGITTSDSDGQDWPADNMGNLENVFPKITMVWETDEGTIVGFEGLEKDAAEDYVEKLKELGYTENGLEMSEDGGILYTKEDSDGNYVMFTYSKDGTGSITYLAKSED